MYVITRYFRYRNASAEVFAVLTQFPNCIVERASIDEAFIDLTDLVESKVRDGLGSVEISKLPTTYAATAGKIKQTKGLF